MWFYGWFNGFTRCDYYSSINVRLLYHVFNYPSEAFIQERDPQYVIVGLFIFCIYIMSFYAIQYICINYVLRVSRIKEICLSFFQKWPNIIFIRVIPSNSWGFIFDKISFSIHATMGWEMEIMTTVCRLLMKDVLNFICQQKEFT